MTQSSKAVPFDVGTFVVYPAHGVGKVVSVGEYDICGAMVDLFVIEFTKDRMVLKLPVKKALSAGLRPICAKKEMDDALRVLSKKTARKKLVWSRRSQEYENKINSGYIGHLADVIRELHFCLVTGEQSYSERQIYQTALDRFIRELSIVENIDEESASNKVLDFLNVA
jgi:CarD family transcriptional regulator